MEARGRIELPIKVLQTFALPLGDRALEHNAAVRQHLIIVARLVPMRVLRIQPGILLWPAPTCKARGSTLAALWLTLGATARFPSLVRSFHN